MLLADCDVLCVQAIICLLLLLATAAVRSQELEPTGTHATLPQLENYIRQFSHYGAKIEKASLAPDFENLGTAIAALLQQMYMSKMGGKALVSDGSGSRYESHS